MSTTVESRAGTRRRRTLQTSRPRLPRRYPSRSPTACRAPNAVTHPCHQPCHRHVRVVLRPELRLEERPPQHVVRRTPEPSGRIGTDAGLRSSVDPVPSARAAATVASPVRALDGADISGKRSKSSGVSNGHQAVEFPRTPIRPRCHSSRSASLKAVQQRHRLDVLREDVVVVRLDRLTADLDGPGETPGRRTRLQDDDPMAPAYQMVGRRQAGHACADDHDVRLWRRHRCIVVATSCSVYGPTGVRCQYRQRLGAPPPGPFTAWLAAPRWRHLTPSRSGQQDVWGSPTRRRAGSPRLLSSPLASRSLGRAALGRGVDHRPRVRV